MRRGESDSPSSFGAVRRFSGKLLRRSLTEVGRTVAGVSNSLLWSRSENALDFGPAAPTATPRAASTADGWLRCKKALTALETEGFLPEEQQLERDYHDLFRYKNRALTGKLLHYAIYESSLGDEYCDGRRVRLVLEAGADINAHARYVKEDRKEKKTIRLDAIHIAAGVGSIPALQVLLENGADVSSFCKINDEDFYTPLHDAAYIGSPDAVAWLLENKADPSLPNIEGFTAVHWLAKKGLEREADLDNMVRTLLKHKAMLDVKTKTTAEDEEGKIPLELAASDDSGFPRRLLYLLAPSFQDHTGISFFDDMCKLSSLNPAAAKQLAMQFKEKFNDAGNQERVRTAAQGKNSVDRLANLFHTAPDAAADMLDLMMTKPLVQDSGHHPIHTRAALSSSFGLGEAAPMRCAYQPDCRQVGDVVMPEWKYDASKETDKFLKQQPKIQWHLQLNSPPSDEDLRKDHVEDVDTKVVLVPNIIDIDIFMALARTRQSNLRIFERLSVQGIIYCLWDHLLRGAVYCWMAFNGMDILAQACVGLSTRIRSPLAQSFLPFCMPLITAGLLRDVVNTCWHFYAHHAKWREHWGKFEAWKKDMRKPGKDPATRPPGLHSLWRPLDFFTWVFILIDVPIMLMKALIVGHYCSRGQFSTGLQQNLLTACTLWQFMKLIWMFRLTIFGKNVNPMVNALCSAAIGRLLMIIIAFFLAVALAFEMLGHPETNEGFWLFLYRGLLFGDGGALDVMGLDPVREFKGGEGFGGRSLLGLLSTLIFNIMILNLLIAVYGNEYEKLEKESESRFQRERAQHCCELLLSLQKIRLPRGMTSSCLGTREAACVAVVGVCLVLGGGSHIYADLCAGACFAFAQVTGHAVLMMSHWFPLRDDNLEGPFEEHFLWICYRQDLLDNPDAEAGDAEVDASPAIAEVAAEIRNHNAKLERRIEDLSAKVVSIEEDVSRQLSQVLELQREMLVNQSTPVAMTTPRHRFMFSSNRETV